MDALTEMKTCTRCGETKPLSEFGLDKASKDGYRSSCKACGREYSREYRKTHQEETNEYSREYYEAHKEEGRKYARTYYGTHKEERHEYDRAHKEESRAWREAHKEEARKRARRWAETYKEEKREHNRRWREANPEKRRAYKAKYRAMKRKVTVGDLTAIARVYDLAANEKSVRCYLCEKLIPKCQRHVDHIIPLSKGGLHTASNLAIACAGCNQKKHTKMPDEVGVLL